MEDKVRMMIRLCGSFWSSIRAASTGGRGWVVPDTNIYYIINKKNKNKLSFRKKFKPSPPQK